jgi:FkbM family methyltransferase
MYRTIENIYLLMRLQGLAATLRFLKARAQRARILPIRLENRVVELRSGDSDFYVLRQIYKDRELDLPKAVLEEVGSPEFILDAGANVGYSTRFLAARYPGAKILAIEPEKENFEMCEKNTRDLENVTCLQCALTGEDGPVGISNPSDQSWTFQVGQVRQDTKEAQNSSALEETVDGFSVAGLLGKVGWPRFDYIKMDIEGSEEQIFSSSDLDWLRNVRVVFVELHSHRATEMIQQIAEQFGFQRLRIGEKEILFMADEAR